MGRLTALRVSFLATLGLVVLYLVAGQTSLMRNVETKLLDLRIRLRGAQHPKMPIALVLIDDQSITELGRWAWSRHHFATVVRQLATAGARVIAFDLLFSEPEAYPTRHALQVLRTAFEALDFPEQSSALQEFHKTLVTLAESEDPDTTLATALREARHTLLAFSFETEASGQRPALATSTPPPLSGLLPIVPCNA